MGRIEFNKDLIMRLPYEVFIKLKSKDELQVEDVEEIDSGGDWLTLRSKDDEGTEFVTEVLSSEVLFYTWRCEE